MPDETVPLTVLDAAAARSWVVISRAVLASRRAQIDALNVFPVPDGDTGTNLYLTFDGAVAEAARTVVPRLAPGEHATLIDAASALRRAMVLSARGNSGVILSQFVAGLCAAVVTEAAAKGTLDGPAFARLLVAADASAWAAVACPVEGTMLSVSEAAAKAARTRALAGADLAGVAAEAVSAARAALLHTPDQLPALATAGVVDAGGAGLLVLFEAFDAVVRGVPAADWVLAEDALVSSRAGAPMTLASSPAYEVVAVLAHADDSAVLRTELAPWGDSLVIGEPVDGQRAVHLHTDHVDEVTRVLHRLSTVVDLRVTVLQDSPSTDGRRPSIIAVAPSRALAETFRAAGAMVVLSAPGHRVPTGQFVSAGRQATAPVVLLPNDADTLFVAQSAARILGSEGIPCQVVPTAAPVQGLAALAVHDPQAHPRADELAMSAAVAATKYATVARATRQARTAAGGCQPGDAVGDIAGTITHVGADTGHVCAQVLAALLDDDTELVTVIVGPSAPPALGEDLAQQARRAGCEVVVLDGAADTHIVELGAE